MTADHNPVFESTQLRYGQRSNLLFDPMGRGRPPKASEATTPGGDVLMTNIRSLVADVFPGDTNETDWIAKLAKRAGVGNETVRRMVKGIGSPRLDNVELVARALGVSLTQMLSARLKAQETPTAARYAPEGRLRSP